MRKRYQNHRGESAVTAKRLADLLAQASAHETVLMQRLHDLEGRDVFARMNGYHHHLASDLEEQPSAVLTSNATILQDPPEEGAANSSDGLVGNDDEELDEYEEYR